MSPACEIGHVVLATASIPHTAKFITHCSRILPCDPHDLLLHFCKKTSQVLPLTHQQTPVGIPSLIVNGLLLYLLAPAQEWLVKALKKHEPVGVVPRVEVSQNWGDLKLAGLHSRGIQCWCCVPSLICEGHFCASMAGWTVLARVPGVCLQRYNHW